MATFIQRNKKKSALAALLLFIRTRKTVTALLLLLVLASFLFVSPSNFILGFPGGARVAAAVAWIAGKVGMDTSKWGLAGGKRDYNDLLAAFRAAKNGGGVAGWGAFMGGKGADGRGGNGWGDGSGAGGGSLDFVKGNRKDLEGRTADGENLPKAGTVAGVLNPDDAKERGEGNAVALKDEDVGNEREGLIKSAFAGGFANGSSGFSGGNSGAVGGGSGWGGSSFGSNGAYAGSSFFSGSGGAAGTKGSDKTKGGLSNIPSPGVPKGTNIAGGSKGRISGPAVGAVKTSISRGMVGAQTGGCSGAKCAFPQLAQGNGRAVLATEKCPAGTCPGEFAAATTGITYDGGNQVGDTTGILTKPDEVTPVVPGIPDIPTGVDPEKMIECSNKVQACETAKQPYYRQMSTSQQQLNDVFNRMGGDCSDPCHCNPCDNDKRQIHSICEGPLKQAVDEVNRPCDLPSYCADMGVAPPPPANAGAIINMCKMNTGSCGPDGFFGALMCMLGS